MKHKLNSKGQAETAADACKNAEDLMSSQPIANAPVVRSQSPDKIEENDDYIRILEWLALLGWILAVCLFFF
jgi:hypothetical protein